MRKSQRTLVWFVLSLASLLGSCRSVEWKERPQELPAGWRELDLHVADGAWVLARDEAAASEAYFEVSDILEFLREAGANVAGTGLVIAVSREDPPLIPGDPGTVARQLGMWHAAAVGLEQPPRGFGRGLSGRFGRIGPDGKKIDIDVGLLMKLLPGGIPKTDTLLKLPPALVERVDWIAVMPTASCVESVTEELIDAALAQADLSFVQRMLVSVMMPTARSKVRNEFREQMRLRLFEACFAARNDFVLHKKQFASALSAAGLSSARASVPRAARRVGDDGVVRIAGYELGEAKHYAVVARIPGIRYPKNGMPAVVVSELPSPEQIAALASFGFSAIVDLSGSPEVEQAANASGLDYAHLPVAGPGDWTRTNVERLAKAQPDRARMTLVCAREPAHAAAIVALRACWVDRANGKSTVRIGRTYGIGELAAQLSLVARRGLRSERSDGRSQVLFGDGEGRLSAVAAFGDGRTVSCGRFAGAILDPSGEQNLVSRGGFDGLLVSRTPSGDVAWARRIGGRGWDSIDGVAVLDAQTFVAVGRAQGDLDLDPGRQAGQLEAPGDESYGFVACFSENGRCMWIRRNVLRRPEVVTAGDRIAVVGFTRSKKESHNRVLLYGRNGELLREHVFDLGGVVVDLGVTGDLVVAGHRIDRVPDAKPAKFVMGVEMVKLDPTGREVWKRQWLSRDRKNGLAWPTGLVRGPHGRITWIAALKGNVDLDPGGRRREVAAEGAQDVCAVRLTADGQLVDWFRIGGVGRTRATACTLSPSGRLWLSGTLGGTVDLDPTDGERIVRAEPSKNFARGCFVACYDADTFRLLSCEVGLVPKRPSSTESRLLSLAAVGDRGVVAVGSLCQPLVWEGRPLGHWAVSEPWRIRVPE